MKKLLEIYYKGFAQKQGFESVLADDFIGITNFFGHYPSKCVS
ncbi:hypothetical protein ACF3OE_05630 [Capnocytophaga canis]